MGKRMDESGGFRERLVPDLICVQSAIVLISAGVLTILCAVWLGTWLAHTMLGLIVGVMLTVVLFVIVIIWMAS